MRLLPKRHFVWKEPKLFLQRREALEFWMVKWWLKPLLILILVAVLLLTWCFAVLDPNAAPPSFGAAILVALGVGVFAFYVAPWVYRLFPSHVRLHEKILMRGNDNVQHKYQDFTSFTWDTADGYLILTLIRHDSERPLYLGAPLDVPQEAITRFLIEKGLAHAPSDGDEGPKQVKPALSSSDQ